MDEQPIKAPEPPVAQPTQPVPPQAPTPTPTPDKSAELTINEKVINEEIKSRKWYKYFKWLFYPDGKNLVSGWLSLVGLIVVIASFICGLLYLYENSKYSELNGRYQDAKTDRDKYQIELAPFYAAALKLNTNAPVEERLHLFSDQMLTISTNLLTAIQSEIPELQLYVNDEPILTTNDTIIDLKKSRTIALSAKNISSIAANDVLIFLSHQVPYLQQT